MTPGRVWMLGGVAAVVLAACERSHGDEDRIAQGVERGAAALSAGRFGDPVGAAWSGLGLFAAGVVPGEGPRGEALARAIGAVRDAAPPAPGTYANWHASWRCLLLLEAWARTRDPALEPPIRTHLDALVSWQEEDHGLHGWAHDSPGVANTSEHYETLTVATEQALWPLAVARQWGIAVDEAALARGYAYLSGITAQQACASDGSVGVVPGSVGYGISVGGRLLDSRQRNGFAPSPGRDGMAVFLGALDLSGRSPRDAWAAGFRHSFPHVREGFHHSACLCFLYSGIGARAAGPDIRADFLARYAQTILSVQQGDGFFAPYPDDGADLWQPTRGGNRDSYCAPSYRTGLSLMALGAERLVVADPSAPYVADGRRFHRHGCGQAGRIREPVLHPTREACVAAGLEPCRSCRP